MLCFLCGKKIGLLRSLVDQQYCSAEHRKEARLAGAQAFRDEEEVELWTVSKSKRRGPRSTATAGQTASMFAFMIVAGLLVAAFLMPGPGPASTAPAISLDPAVRRGLFEKVGDSISEVIRSRAPVTLHQDFNPGVNIASWTGWTASILPRADDPRHGLRVDDPRLASAAAPVLRIWKRSTALQNYQMEFAGAIEKKSLSWAFRASDEKNYYATKILITRPGPLPITLERNSSYRVRVSVQDDHFVTFLNGQVISSWSDKRLLRGGVGFFDDADDPQKVAWINVSEHDSMLGRMLSHFSLFIPPGFIPPGGLIP